MHLFWSFFQDFKILTRDSKRIKFDRGQLFCQEHRSSVEKKIHVLLSGMMTVRCDGLFLQAIQPNEFIDSVEWKSRQYGQDFPTHQVCHYHSEIAIILVW